VIDHLSCPDEVVGNDEVLGSLNKEVNGLPPLYGEGLVMRDISANAG
jgi:hypothetical protein